MIRVLISVIAIALTSTTMIRSAYANDSQSAALSSQAATGSDVDDVQNKAPSNKENGRWLLRGPKAIAGCCAGFVIGTPICFARKLPQETKDGAHGIVGSIVKDNNNKFLLVPATLVYLPAACVALTLEAPTYALKDAYMANKPFSKEQFSLGKLDPDKGSK